MICIKPNQVTAQHDVEVNGKITFNNGLQNYGVYGLRVYLFFNDTTDTLDPQLLFPDEDIEGKTYDLVEEDGSFAFDFSYTGDLSDYNQILVWSSTRNPAAIIQESDSGGGGGTCDPDSKIECIRKAVPQIGGGYSATPMDSIKFFEIESAIMRDINGSNPTIIETGMFGTLGKEQGLVFRGAMLSREYLLARHGGTPGYSIPQIYIRFDLEGPQADQGQFKPQANPVRISFKKNGLDFTTVAHEYGHYVNYLMWDEDSDRLEQLPDMETELVEGWAQFYSFATRNWANNLYNDLLEDGTDNMEEGPFNNTPYSDNAYNNELPNVPRIASYMWNVYDSPNLGVFHATKYSGSDNDDIGSDPMRVFTIMENLGENDQTFTDFHADFLNGLSQDEQNSINDIKDFTDAPNIYKMRAAFTKNLTAQLQSSSVDFSWDNQSYDSSDDYQNGSTAYHKLYLENENGLQTLSGQISYSNESYTFTPSSDAESGTYEIRTFNSAGKSLGSSKIFLGVSAPTGLVVTNEGASFGGPRLDWDDHSDTIDHYIVYRYSSNPPQGQPHTQQIGTTTSSQFTDINVAINGNSETFEYHVLVKKGVFVSGLSNIVSVTGDDASPFKRIADEKEALPEKFALEQNYPNPFNPSTNLSYDVSERAEVTLEVYNMLGRKVQTLVNTVQQAGSYQISFDASGLSNGMYIARFKAIGLSGNLFVQEQKMTLVK